MLLFCALFPALLFAQGNAVAFLDKAVARLKSDAALQMNYDYTVYDDDGVVAFSDTGIMRLDKERYSLLMENMKVWCDGTTQWSYMRDIDEIYITDADSEEAQNLSPLYFMEKYRKNYSVSLDGKGEVAVVTLLSKDKDEEIDKVELYIDKETYRLESLFVYMPAQGKIEVFLNGYVAGCSFDKEIYACPVDEFPSAEVIDMR